MKLFLDDVRDPQDCLGYMYNRIGKQSPIYLEEWLVVRNYHEFVEAVDKHWCALTHVSFDHDLAEEHYDESMHADHKVYEELAHSFKEKTGVDCAEYLLEKFKKEGKSLPVIYIHSMNPAGCIRLINVFA